MTVAGTTPAGGAPAADLSSAAGQESAFQSFFEQGAFNQDGQLDEVDRKVIQGDPQPGDEPQAEEEQAEAPQWRSFDEFLTATKAERDAVMALPVTIKVDGVEKQVPLSDLVKVTQLEGHVNNKSIALSQERERFVQEQNAARQALGQQLNTHKAMGNAAMSLMNRDFQQVDWNGLRAQNPAQYAALYADFQQRQGEINQFMQAVTQREQEAVAQQQQQIQQFVTAERDKLLNAMPEWRDTAKFDAAKSDMVKYARNLGFSDAELGNVTDHRILRVIHDAARFAALQAQAPGAVKQVRQAPAKVARPGPRTNAQPGDAQRAAVIERFTKNPRDVDAQEAYFEFLSQ
jgi:hypothetical protein